MCGLRKFVIDSMIKILLPPHGTTSLLQVSIHTSLFSFLYHNTRAIRVASYLGICTCTSLVAFMFTSVMDS